MGGRNPGDAPGPLAVTQTVIALSPMDEARLREAEAARRRHAAEDALREESGEVEMIAITGFTLVTDEHPEGRAILPGRPFTIFAYDVPSFLGRARKADEEPEEARGPRVG